MINIEVYSRGFKKENRSRLPYHSRVISYILVDTTLNLTDKQKDKIREFFLEYRKKNLDYVYKIQKIKIRYR